MYAKPIVPLSSQWVVMESPAYLRRVGVKYFNVEMREVALIGEASTPTDEEFSVLAIITSTLLIGDLWWCSER